MGRKVLTIDRCTQEKWVPDGRRSKRFTLQIYEKQRVRASSPCILFPYRPNKSTPTRRASAWRETSARATGGSPVSDATTRGIGGSGARETLSPPPGSAAEAADGGGPASSGGTSPRSPPDEGETPRGQSQGDRRKPRERRRSPKSRRVGGAEKSSVLHPKAQRGRQTVEHVHQAVERRHALPQAKGRHRAAYQHTTRGIGGSVAGVDQNPLASRHLHQARQSRPPGRRPSAGRAGKAWRNHVEAQGIFARGNGRMRPRSGRFERGHGRLSALGGKKQHPLRTPGQVGGAAQTNQCGHLEKIDVVNEIRAPLAAPVTNIEGMPPEALATQPQTARHGGSAKVRSGHPAAPVGNSKACPPKPPPHNRKPRGTAGA